MVVTDCAKLINCYVVFQIEVSFNNLAAACKL